MKPNMFDFVERLVNWNGILGIQLGIEIIIDWRLIDSFLVHVSYDTLQVHKFISKNCRALLPTLCGNLMQPYERSLEVF